MFSAPVVVVYGLDDAQAALRPGLRVTLLSGAGAGLYAGPAWWLALMRAAMAEFPATESSDILDCADAPGQAFAALRLGQKRLILSPACRAFPAVADAAAALNAVVLPDRPPALDLALPGAHRHLPDWLKHGA